MTANPSSPQESGRKSARGPFARRLCMLFAMAAVAAAPVVYIGGTSQELLGTINPADGRFAARIASSYLRDRDPQKARWIMDRFVKDPALRVELARDALIYKERDFAEELYRQGIGKDDPYVHGFFEREKEINEQKRIIRERENKQVLNPDQMLAEACESGSVRAAQYAISRGADPMKNRRQLMVNATGEYTNAEILQFIVEKCDIGGKFTDSTDIIAPALMKLVRVAGSKDHAAAFAYLAMKFPMTQQLKDYLLADAAGCGNVAAVRILTGPFVGADASSAVNEALYSEHALEILPLLFKGGARITADNNHTIARALGVWAMKNYASDDPQTFRRQREVTSFILAQGLTLDIAVLEILSNPVVKQTNPEFYAQIATHFKYRNSEMDAIKAGNDRILKDIVGPKP